MAIFHFTNSSVPNVHSYGFYLPYIANTEMCDQDHIPKICIVLLVCVPRVPLLSSSYELYGNTMLKHVVCERLLDTSVYVVFVVRNYSS